MILHSLLTFLPALLTGYLLVNILLPSKEGAGAAYKVFLGIGAGLGLVSCLYFIWLLIIPTGEYFFLLQLILLLFMAVLTIVFRKNKAVKLPITRQVPDWISILLAAIAGLVLVAFFYNLSRLVLMNTHGDYDAHAIWNLRARFIYRTGADWLVSFSPDLYWKFHTDYPLLIPLNTVWAWRFLGGEVMRVPAIQAMLFTSGLIGLLFFSVYILRGLGSASLSTLILLSTPMFAKLGSFQTADIPLTYFLLATLSLLFMYSKVKSTGILILAGLMAGLAAWTKNEGFLFAVVVLGVGGLLTLLRKTSIRELLALVGGAGFPIAVTGYFKIFIGTSNDLLSKVELFTKIIDPSRYITIFRMLISGLISLGEWPFSIVIVLIIYMLVMRSQLRSDERPGILIVLSLLILQLIGYLLVYLLTPHPLEWHLTYSLERLLLHFLPGILFLLPLFTSAPGQVSREVNHAAHN